MGCCCGHELWGRIGSRACCPSATLSWLQAHCCEVFCSYSWYLFSPRVSQTLFKRLMPIIVETNLKKQGVLPVTFANPADYDRIPSECLISTQGLQSLAPGSALSLLITPKTGKPFQIPVVHTMSEDQIGYFKAGSALNMIAASISASANKATNADAP